MKATTLSNDSLLLLREIVFRESAICINDDDVVGLESRLLRMLKTEGLSSIEELLQKLRTSHPELIKRTIEAVTINETSFFRDSCALTLLFKEVIPLIRANKCEGIKLWCAGCSTGQEAYSIAIAALESSPDLVPHFSIIATDISPKVIEKARTGKFSDFELRRGISDEIRDKYFIKDASGWQVRSEVSRMIEFKVSNMNQSIRSIPESFDIVFLRNVMLYFNESTRINLIRNIKDRISQDGYLFVGSSERTLPPGNGFNKVKHDKCQFYQVDNSTN